MKQPVLVRLLVAAIVCLCGPGMGQNGFITAQDAEVTPIQDGAATQQLMAQDSNLPTVEWVTYDLFQASDHEFDSFISPMTNPIYFEDPRAVSEIRPIFLHHKVPLAAGGGTVQLYAAQVRLRLTENISLIAVKDGYATTSNPILGNGWADIAAGLKFTLFRDVANQSILSGGFTYELPTGEAAMFQGNGDGEFNIFLAGAQKLAPRINWMTASGLRVPVNSTDESMSSYWSTHLDAQVTQNFYALMEFNWYHWLNSGADGPIAGIEGLDVINFGNPGVAGNDIVTGAFGFKFKAGPHLESGVAWEMPLTQRRDILDNRLTVDLRLRY